MTAVEAHPPRSPRSGRAASDTPPDTAAAPERDAAPGQSAPDPAAVPTRFLAPRWPAPALLTAGAACWVVALLLVDVAHPSLSGLTVTMGPVFVAALALNCFGFAYELYAAGRSVVLAMSVLLLIATMKATVPLLERNPEYPWTYKHLGVVDVLATQGHIVDPRDIYQQWPAFFAMFASLETAAGVTPERVAAWSSVGFSVIDVVILYACFRKLGLSARVAFTGLFLFEALAWPDLNYFSPQAFGLALSLGVLLLVICRLRSRPGTEPPRWNPFARWLDRRSERPDGVVPPSGGRVGLVLTVVAVCTVFAVLTAAHQLSPYVVLAEIAALTIFDLVRPRWLVFVLLAIAVGYFLPQAGSVTSQFKIFDGFNIFANAAGNAVAQVPGSSEERLSALCARALSLGLWGAGMVVLLVRRRRLGAVAVPALLGLAPFSILVAGNYGGEAIYRVILFSSPWFAILLAGVAERVPRRRWGAIAAGGIALSVLTVVSLQASQGQFALNTINSGQVQAARYFYAHAPVGSSMTLFVQDFPARISGDYNDYNQKFTTEPALLPDDALGTGTAWNSTVLPTVEKRVRAGGGTNQFLVVSQGMKAFVQYWGLLRPASLNTFETTLRSSTAWTVFYQNNDTTIFELKAA